MGRAPKFAREDMTRAALRLVADGGPAALTMAALAEEVGAPTGSIYHRYASREHLLAALWMEVVESFQEAFVTRLDAATDLDGAVHAARLMPQWSREHPREARLLLLHHRRDFVAGAWPRPLVERAAALEPRLGEALRGFARRALGRDDAEAMACLRYALLDAPFGGLKPYVQVGAPPPPVLDALVERTVRATLAPLLPSPAQEAPWKP